MYRRSLAALVLAGCGRLGFDATALDAAGAHDEDADGVADESDNCPAIANASQDNADGDGVGDACDPSAATAERIVLFASFAGPTDWQTFGAGTWSVEGDDLRVTWGDTSATAMIAPDLLAAPLVIRARYTLVRTDPATTNWTMSIVDTFDAATLDSQKCGEASPRTLAIGHEMAGSTVAAQNTAFPEAFTDGAEYETTMVHDTSQIRCTSQIVALGAAATTTVTPPYRTSGRVGLRVRSSDVLFHSVLVIGAQ